MFEYLDQIRSPTVNAVVQDVGDNLCVHGGVLHPLGVQKPVDVLLLPAPLLLGPPLQCRPLPTELPLYGPGQGLDVHGDEGVVSLLLTSVRKRQKLVPAVLLRLRFISNEL